MANYTSYTEFVDIKQRISIFMPYWAETFQTLLSEQFQQNIDEAPLV